MDQYCVVLCGLQAGTMGDAAAWQPVAVALKLDHAEFERRVVAALPRIVRQDLDQATAERIAQVLQALHVDARVLPHDPQLVYIERGGASRGPLPQSSLGDFIQPGEAYRLRGTTTWQPWPDPVGPESVVPTVGSGDVDDATASASTGAETADDMTSLPSTSVTGETSEPLANEAPTGTDDELEHAAPAALTADAADQHSDIAQEGVAAGAVIGAELLGVMPPPLPSAPAAQSSSTSESSGSAATAPEPDAAAWTRDDEPVEPVRETLSSGAPEAADPATPEITEVAAPKRSRTGRIVVLVVLAALAVWAYRYWAANTHDAAPPAAVSASQLPVAGLGPATPPARAVPGDAPTPPLASSASVAAVTPTPARSATASAPATAGSTPAAATSTAMPLTAASTPAPATSSVAPATASPGTLPAIAGTVISARPVPAAAASTALSATSTH